MLLPCWWWSAQTSKHARLHCLTGKLRGGKLHFALQGQANFNMGKQSWLRRLKSITDLANINRRTFAPEPLDFPVSLLVNTAA